jgi:hypothetical protein
VTDKHRRHAAFGFMNRKWPGMVLMCDKDADGRQVIGYDCKFYFPKVSAGHARVRQARARIAWRAIHCSRGHLLFP